jgi:FtsZ-interacting cell division protein ZipA
MKVGRSNRGEILGRLVGILVLLLVPIWALGHWLSPISTSTTTSSETLNLQRDQIASVVNKESFQSQQSSGDAPSSTDVTDASATKPAVNAQQINHQIDAQMESLMTRQELLVQEIKSIASKVDGQSENLTSLEQSNTALQQAMSEHKQTLSEQLESTQKEMAQLKSMVADSASRSAVTNGETASTATASAATTSTVTGAVRPWTSTSGKQVNAALLGREGDVAILTARGQTFRVPLNQLIPADQDAIRKRFPTP